VRTEVELTIGPEGLANRSQVDRLAAVKRLSRPAMSEQIAESLEGYVTNVWDFPAQKVQLLVSGYDGSGRRVGQLIAWGPRRINPGSRVYFDVPVPPAASYDVAIFAWDWVQRGPGRSPFRP
jgi:hypothetical protein